MLVLLGIMGANAQDNYNLIVGTYTNECDSQGIYVYDFNTITGAFKPKANSKGVENPSFLSIAPDNRFIYSVNENGDKSYVSSFNYNPQTGKVDFINKRDSEGADPCYIINDDSNVIVANYSGGTIAVFDKKDKGSLTNAKQVIKHSGSSINKSRQESPHVHMVYFSPDKKYVLATDLGTDKIYTYQYNPDGGKETLVLKSEYDIKPGNGPRHLAFHPNRIFVYLLNELTAVMTVLEYKEGSFSHIQDINITPFHTGQNGAADIHFSDDGKFLYATNRGDANTISVFRVHANGRVNQVQEIRSGGETPRNFAIAPKGNYVLIGNQKSNYISIFKRDKVTGMLEATENKIELCAPVCIIFTPAK